MAIEANAWAAKNNESGSGDDLIQSYLKSVASKATVTDREAAEFYAENMEMFKGATLEQTRPEIKGYLLGQKQGKVVRDHVMTISRRHSIRVSSSWAKEQYSEWIKNPVEQARRSGIPTMVEFGSDGCKPCEMMAPIIDEVRARFSGKLNVLFVHVKQQPVLGAHYDTPVIPVQMFYDKQGNESYRHEGFLDKPAVLKRIADLGVK
jgi:thiol-disulfide isomerase/thioredoxin